MKLTREFEGETYSYASSWRQVAKVSHHAVTVSQRFIWLRLESHFAGEVLCEENYGRKVAFGESWRTVVSRTRGQGPNDLRQGASLASLTRLFQLHRRLMIQALTWLFSQRPGKLHGGQLPQCFELCNT